MAIFLRHQVQNNGDSSSNPDHPWRREVVSEGHLALMPVTMTANNVDLDVLIYIQVTFPPRDYYSLWGPWRIFSTFSEKLTGYHHHHGQK